MYAWRDDRIQFRGIIIEFINKTFDEDLREGKEIRIFAKDILNFSRQGRRNREKTERNIHDIFRRFRIIFRLRGRILDRESLVIGEGSFKGNRGG